MAFYQKRRFLLSFLYTFFIGLPVFTLAQQGGVNSSSVIRLQNRDIYVTSNSKQWTDSVMLTNTPTDPIQVLLHFSTLPTLSQRALLQQNGITLLDYIPDNTYTAIVLSPKNVGILAQPQMPVHSILNIPAEWKIEQNLLHQIQSIKNNNNIEVLVTFNTGITDNSVRQYITNTGGQIHACGLEKYGSYKVILPVAKVHALAGWYGVKYISRVANPVPCDLQSRPAVRGNLAATPANVGGWGLMGDSVVVGVGDNSSGIYHADLKDRIINFCPGPISHHGEHVNGIIGSATIVDPLAASMAPHVSLIDYYFDLILPETGPMFHDYNMNITNNSYAVILGDCGYAGTYDAYAQFVDTMAMQFPYVLHVFASGNDGSNTCSPYLAGFATVAGGYQPAKNNLVVGSFTDFLVQAGDESRGPTKDGRIKPEIVATGLGAYSTINVDGYEWAAGTSMASPQAAGGLAIITQRYKQLHNDSLPNSDLLKALALNGALDLGNPGPDFSYGFGSMDEYRSILMIDSGHYVRNSITNGDSQFFHINIPANTAQVKILICWNDVPANPLAATQLVNDLDLFVTDPSFTHYLPLVPDPTPANVNNIATQQEDHLNNVEQVTIINPIAGNYTIRVKGYKITTSTQPYSLVYDIIPKGVLLTYPLGAERLSNVDSIRIFWDGIADTNTYTVKYTTDSGTTWTIIDNNVPASVKHSDFMPSGINSGNCMVQVSRNGTTQTATSARFTINTQPVVQVDTAQCPGYISIHWLPIPNATGYQMVTKVGYYMKVVDSTTDTFYTFSNRSLIDYSYVAVLPIINKNAGYRSVSAKVLANSGNCINAISNGDIMAVKIISPTNGRQHTSTQLSNNETLKIQLRNLYNSPCSNFSVVWRVNTGVWQTTNFTTPLPANSIDTISITGLDLSALGAYTITAVVHNLQTTDPNTFNDTIVITVINIPNDTLNLTNSFTDSFETMPVFSVNHDSIGISPNGHWDFVTANDTGRLRTFVSDDVTFGGHRAISLDENQNVSNGSSNQLVGTFNLSNYDTTTTELRLDFDYLLHGTPKTYTGNIVQVRNNDTTTWQPLYTYDLSAYPGYITHVQSLSLTDALRASKTNFTPATQVAFGQNDTSLIAGVNYGNGMTFDNFRLYTVANDAQLVAIVNPLPTNCGLPTTTPLTILVRNGVNQTLHNVLLQYAMDSGTVYSATIDSIKAKDTIYYTFSQMLNIGVGQTHTISVWLTEAGDTYHANDSILGYKFRNSPIITTYPYLQNFEAGDGGYFSDGYKNSWQYGTPASPKINKAASGTKAWKTNLTGNYNTLEKSYLYSPCFDISALNSPMLSFSAALDIENCGNTLCDQAYIEYSFDGVIWTKLGDYDLGTNWYDSTFSVWNTEGFTRWHVASISLPKPPAGATMHLRFAMVADPGTDFEGFAVDDIHIFDRAYSILSAVTPINIAQTVSGNNWADFTYTFLVAASLQPNSQNLGNTNVAQYPHDTLSNPAATQYTYPRSYNITPQNIPTANVGSRLYLTENDFVRVMNDTSCPSCTRPIDAYSLGITQYQNNINPTLQNNTLADDTGGQFTYYPYQAIQWVPFDNGYYAQLSVPALSEFWFNDGGPTGNCPAGIDYLNFNAIKTGQNVLLNWISLIDTGVYHYMLEKSTDGYNFTALLDTPSANVNPVGQYVVIDGSGFGSNTTLYYRLKWTMTGKSMLYYSPIRTVNSNDSVNAMITFDAMQLNHTNVQLNWTSGIDAAVVHYVLERAINGAGYTTIANTPSLKHFSQQYFYTDMPANNINLPNATPIQYRLTAVLADSTKITVPIRTIDWINNNSLIKIYPNPTYTGDINLVYTADTGTVVAIQITDMQGRTAYTAQATATTWYNTTTFTTFHRAKGIYIVKIEIGDKSYVVKMEWE